MMQQSPQQLNSIAILKVPSFEVVKNYQVQAGMAQTFMHDTLPYMFIKTAPTSPIEHPKITIYKLLEVESMDEDAPVINDDYVTRKEYLELKKSIASIEERMNADESIYRSAKKKWSDNANSGSDRNYDTRSNKPKSNGKPNEPNK